MSGDDPDASAPSGSAPRPGAPRESRGAAKVAPAANAQALAGALHEVSNALTVMLGWLDRARAASDPSGREEALAIVAARARLAQSIAREAITANSEAGEEAPVRATELVEEVIRGIRVEADRRGIAIDARTSGRAGDASTVIARATSALQVLTNLLLNALAFSPRGATVKMSLDLRENDALFVVSDEGPGVPEEVRALIFEGGVTSRRGGAGIGLRHSAELAAQAGGELRLARAELGARFELRWPIAEIEAKATSIRADRSRESDPTTQPSGATSQSPRKEGGTTIAGARILVVEDDAAVVDLLALALGARGAEVVSVPTRERLRDALATGAFDAALLDMSPLVGDVEGAVRAVRTASPRARLVVMSGSLPPSPIEGATHWVRKPFEVKEIVEALSAPPHHTGDTEKRS